MAERPDVSLRSRVIVTVYKLAVVVVVCLLATVLNWIPWWRALLIIAAFTLVVAVVDAYQSRVPYERSLSPWYAVWTSAAVGVAIVVPLIGDKIMNLAIGVAIVNLVTQLLLHKWINAPSHRWNLREDTGTPE